MTESFTDKLKRELSENEQDMSRVSKWAVVKEIIKDSWDDSQGFTLVLFVLGPIILGLSTHTLIKTSNRVPIVEERVFQIFEVRGISVEIMSLKDPILSTVIEATEVTFSEIVELANEHEMIYFSRPSHRFFVVGEYWDTIHYYDNMNLRKIYVDRDLNRLIVPLGVIGGVLALILVRPDYHRKYKEMAGL